MKPGQELVLHAFPTFGMLAFLVTCQVGVQHGTYEGIHVKVGDTVRSFAAIVDGECDDIPEQAFRYAGNIDDVRARAAKL